MAASKDQPWVGVLLENEPYPQDVRVRNEAETMAAAGYRVTVVAPCSPHQPGTESINGVQVRRFWLPVTGQTLPGFLLEYSLAHLQLVIHTVRLLWQGVDALHLCNPPDTLSPLLLLGRLFGRRTVFDNHDLFPELFEFRFGPGKLSTIVRFFQRLALSVADVVLTTNESQRTHALEVTQRDPASVIVVRNGPHGRSDAIASKARSGGGTKLSIVFVGALAPQDGVVTLAEVLRQLVQRHGIEAQLVVVGAGPSGAELRNECEQNGLGGSVILTGQVPAADVPEWLAAADICVDPAPCNALNQGSTMIKIAEYMAAGKPIVAFDLLETRRTAGDAALYAPCGDVEAFASLIARLAHDAALRNRLTSIGRDRLPHLLWERSAAALLDAYQRILPLREPISRNGDGPV